MAEGTVGDILKGRPSQGRALRFALAWSLDLARWEEAFRAKHGPDRPFLAWHHVDSFRLAVAELNYGRVFGPDGSSYRPTVWEDHELELAVLTVRWPASLVLMAWDEFAQVPSTAKCFRDGMVYDLPHVLWTSSGWAVDLVGAGTPSVFYRASGSEPWGPRDDWPAMVEEWVSRPPRPCPHPPEMEAGPA